MRVVLQRVKSSTLKINGEIYSSIGLGYLLLVSFCDEDNQEIASKMARKITNLRIFEDENGKTNLSLKDKSGEIMSISQFTLYADLKGGNRPSFTKCLKFEEASKLYDFFNEELEKMDNKVARGIFGEDMKIELINDGPFTIILDSKEILK